MSDLKPQFVSPATVRANVEARRRGVVFSTSTPSTMGEAVTPVQEALRPIAAHVEADKPARNIRRTRVAKHQPRLKAEPFDPSKVSSTLNGSRA